MSHPIDDLFRNESRKLHRMPPERVWRKLERRLDRGGTRRSLWMRWGVAAALLVLVGAVGYFTLSWLPHHRRLAEAGQWEELGAGAVANDRLPHANWALYETARPEAGTPHLESRRLMLRSESLSPRVQVSEGGTVSAVARLLGLWHHDATTVLLHQEGQAVSGWLVQPTRVQPLFRIEGNQFVFTATEPPMATRLQYHRDEDGFIELASTWLGELTIAFHPQANEWRLRCNRHTAWYEALAPALGPGRIMGDQAVWVFRRDHR